MAVSGSPRCDTPDDAAERLLARAERSVRAARQAGVERLEVAAAWADLHLHPGPTAHPLDHWTEIGATGLRIYEFAAAELAVSLEVHPLAAHCLMGDAVDLQRRLPRTWRAVQELRVDDWVARRIATRTRDLPDHLAVLVDAAIEELLGVLPAGRLFAVVDARVVEADPAAADARAAKERTRRGVWQTKPEAGTGGLFVRGDAADVKRFYAMADHIAHLVAEHGDGEETLDELRARAVGILADPQGAADFLAGGDPARGRTMLYVHTTLEQLASPKYAALGLSRVEDIGAFTRSRLVELLGHEHVSIRPVLALAGQAPVDAYEVPGRLAEALHLTKPADVFPYASSLSRTLDKDHTVPYEPDGPPGQTRLDNLGKLTRRHHRVKTHATGWTVAQLPGGRFLWVTPHGRYRITDPSGTHVVQVFSGNVVLAA
ncbi:hypothetical protein [Marmoricola sp. URHA0025 HA25]